MARLLARLHAVDWPARIAGPGGPGENYDHIIPPYDEGALLIEVSLLADWYVPAFARSELSVHDRENFFGIWNDLAGKLKTAQTTLVLRDFHSPNLIWRDAKPFPVNLGLIDFQYAVIGPTAYDVASLGQDARVDIAAELEASVVSAYINERGNIDENFDGKSFMRDYAILGAQRATKMPSIFVRLDRRDGKPDYLHHLPRMRDYLARKLAHPALAAYRRWCEDVMEIDLAAKVP